MKTLSRLIKSKDFISVSLSVVLSVLLVAVSVQAATTISTNISTGGTLSVTGASTLTGALTTEGSSTFGDAATDRNIFTGTLQASTTALFTGGLTTYGSSTFGDAATDRNIFTGTLQASTTALFTGGVTFYGNLTLDKAATTTVTFSQTGINLDANTLVIDPNSNRVGIGTAAPKTLLEVNGTASTTSLIVGGNSTNGTVAGIVFGTCTYNPGEAITASSTVSTNCTGATGIRTTDKVFITPRSLENHLVLTSASSTATDVIQVSVYNNGWGGPITPSSATWDWMSIR